MDPGIPAKRTRTSLLRFRQIGRKTDSTPLRRWRIHKTANRRQHGGNGFIVRADFFPDARFEEIQASGKFLVRGEDLAELHKGTHHVNTHSNGARAIENSGGHNGAVFGERVGQELGVVTTPAL